MRCFILMGAFCLVSAGCAADAKRDPTPIYDAVLSHEFPGDKKAAEVFLFVDGKDPAAELLDVLRKTWPKLEAGSKAPKGKAARIDFSELVWSSANGAQLRGGASNGMNGKVHRFFLVKKQGNWVVEKAELEAIS